MNAAVLGLLGAAAVAGVVTDAAAFCRATTCNPDTELCPIQDGCDTGGEPLYWPSSCVTFSAQEAGSAKHGISSEALSRALEKAFSRWMSVDCGGGAKPSIEVNDVGTVACSAVEYNTDEGNANIVMFRDDEWPHPESYDAYAQTRLTFDPHTGMIKDAEIELNGTEGRMSLGGTEGIDLDSVLTHEVGHFLGLGHSLEETATMRAAYQIGDEPLTTLSQDDVDGICAIYPPNRTTATSSCAPLQGFSSECGDGISDGADGAGDDATLRERGCAVSPSLGRSKALWSLGLLAMVAFVLKVRRRALRATFCASSALRSGPGRLETDRRRARSRQAGRSALRGPC